MKTEGNIDQEFRLKEMAEKNYFLKEIKQYELISKKYKKIYKILNYAEHLLILASTVSGCVSIFSFVSFGVPIGIVSSSRIISICAMPA